MMGDAQQGKSICQVQVPSMVQGIGTVLCNNTNTRQIKPIEGQAAPRGPRIMELENIMDPIKGKGKGKSSEQ